MKNLLILIVLLFNLPFLANDTIFFSGFEKEITTEWASTQQNGEAIYGTLPWFIYGEGPTEIPEGYFNYHHNNHFAQVQFVASDIRFTVKGDNLFATCLGNPGESLKIAALNSSFKLQKDDILKITHLGTGKEISFNHNEKALELDLKGIQPDEKANAFKIELDYSF